MTNSPQFYTWKNFRCAYTVHHLNRDNSETTPLVLIHPIGVGLSGNFWQRFIDAWLSLNPDSVVYNPDLLGCGASDMPSVAYYSIDWANQLKYFLENIVKKPAILVVQGASFPIAIKLVQNISNDSALAGLVLSGPPAWRIMTEATKPVKNKLLWNLLFNSPLGLGNLFYLYARRRQFIESFSVRQLFANADRVDDNWLDKLTEAATNSQSRFAVFSFLAGFWREDYTSAITQIQQATLVIFGEKASSIIKKGKTETAKERLDTYIKYLPQGQGCIIPGRNVLPYESTSKFVNVVTDFVKQLK
ncbi:MAG: alpha/beta fold hydrolase [Xenococcaceae cyanobacterium]